MTEFQYRELQFLDRLGRRVGRNDRNRTQTIPHVGVHLGGEHVESAAARPSHILVGDVHVRQPARRVAVGEIDAQLIHATAHVARQLRERTVTGVRPRRQTPPETFHRWPVRRGERTDTLGHVAPGHLAHEIQVSEIALDHVGVRIDHRVIELGADVTTGKAFE